MIFVKVLNIRIILLFYYYFILIFDSVLFQAHFMFKFCKKKMIGRYSTCQLCYSFETVLVICLCLSVNEKFLDLNFENQNCVILMLTTFLLYSEKCHKFSLLFFLNFL